MKYKIEWEKVVGWILGVMLATVIAKVWMVPDRSWWEILKAVLGL
jgi:hypothetical protein